MQDTIIAKIIEIDIVRHGFFYFMNRRENGRTVVNAQQISRDRAKEVYEANDGLGRQRRINTVDFTDIRPHEWSWTVTVEEQMEVVNII